MVTSNITVTPGWLDDPKKGFETHREFLNAVFLAGDRCQTKNPKLRYLATVGSDEAGTHADPYGGFLIPSGYSPGLLSVPTEDDPLAGRTTMVPMDTATVEFAARVDKDHSTSVSGGLRVYRRAETDTVDPSRAEFEQVILQAHALYGVSYATEELISRSPRAFIALLEAGFRDEFASHGLEERLHGSGVGMSEGMLTSPAKIEIAKEVGQAADTIVYDNVLKMATRCWGFGKSIWLANHNTLPQLVGMTVDVGTSGVPVWQFSAREGFPDMLFGRPCYFTEYAATLGDAGDLILTNPTQYLEGVLTPLASGESTHARFETHERCFKFWLENDGRCWWRSELTPRNGDTMSPIVTLAARE